VVANAVAVEPVSGSNFPANREKYREIYQIWPQHRFLAPNQRADSMAYSRIPYSKKRGIIFEEQGKLSQEQGKLLQDEVFGTHTDERGNRYEIAVGKDMNPRAARREADSKNTDIKRIGTCFPRVR
jgi:hypothetical protein